MDSSAVIPAAWLTHSKHLGAVAGHRLPDYTLQYRDIPIHWPTISWYNFFSRYKPYMPSLCSRLGLERSAWFEIRALAGPWKSLNFFQISRPGKSLKTDMVLESPWICVWRSLKVLEFDFLKRRDWTSWYRKRCSRWLLSDLKYA